MVMAFSGTNWASSSLSVLWVRIKENTKFQQNEISNVLEVIEEVELYHKEMLFIVEHESEKQAFLLCRNITLCILYAILKFKG
jgi:hypothetical protein